MSNIPLTTVQLGAASIRGKNAESVYDEEFVLYAEVNAADAAVGSHVIDIDIPIGFVATSVYVRTTATSAIATGTTLGVGPVAGSENYADIAHTSMDAVGNTLFVMATANAPTTAITQVAINSTDGSGSVAGTIDGTFVIKLTGRVYNTIGE